MHLERVELVLGPIAVTEWIMAYFSPPPEKKQVTNAFNALKGASPVASTNRMPLILQVRYLAYPSSIGYINWSYSILAILAL